METLGNTCLWYGGVGLNTQETESHNHRLVWSSCSWISFSQLENVVVCFIVSFFFSPLQLLFTGSGVSAAHGPCMSGITERKVPILRRLQVSGVTFFCFLPSFLFAFFLFHSAAPDVSLMPTYHRLQCEAAPPDLHSN